MKTLTITLEGGPYLIRREGLTPKEARNFVTSYTLFMQAQEAAANAPAVLRFAKLKAELEPGPRSDDQKISEPEKHEVDAATAIVTDVNRGSTTTPVEPAGAPLVSTPKARLLTDHRPNGDICGWWKVDGEERYCPRQHRTPGAMHKWADVVPPRPAATGGVT